MFPNKQNSMFRFSCEAEHLSTSTGIMNERRMVRGGFSLNCDNDLGVSVQLHLKKCSLDLNFQTRDSSF